VEAAGGEEAGFVLGEADGCHAEVEQGVVEGDRLPVEDGGPVVTDDDEGDRLPVEDGEPAVVTDDDVVVEEVSVDQAGRAEVGAEDGGR
jgi:hypothetical protein